MRSFSISGSGPEDIGRTITRAISARRDAQEYGLREPLTPRELAARAEDARHRAAEDAALSRRLDRDRIIVAALDSLESESHDKGLSYLAGAANIPLERFPGDTRFADSQHRADYIRELLAEIRAELSPLVR